MSSESYQVSIQKTEAKFFPQHIFVNKQVILNPHSVEIFSEAPLIKQPNDPISMQ